MRCVVEEPHGNETQSLDYSIVAIAAAAVAVAWFSISFSPTPIAGATFGWPDSATLTLREKEAYDQWLQEQDEAAFRTLIDGAPVPDEPLGQVSHVLRGGYESAIDGRWEEAIKAAREVPPVRRSYFLADLLSLSLHGAPIEVIEELIGLNDGLLPEDAILGLSERYWDGAVGVARELIARGMDIHHVDSFGRNAFSSLARSYPVNLEMAALLAEHSVSPKPSPRGKDPLDLILSRMVRRLAWAEPSLSLLGYWSASEPPSSRAIGN